MKIESIEKYKQLNWYQLEDGKQVDVYEFTYKELDSIIQTAIEKRERAILDDIDFGYSAEMIKGKIINKAYTP